MKHKNSHLMIGYWSRLRRGRAVPDQCDVDPRAIKRMLSFVFILDAADVERPVYRLAGTQLCQNFGTELKGLSFLAHWEDESRNALVPLLRQSLKSRQPICLASIAATAECGMIEVETTLAPISFGGVRPTRFLGLVQILGDVNALAGRPIAFERLIASQLVQENETFVEPAALPALASVPGHPKAPHLRLVVNQDAVAQENNVENVARLLDVFGTGISLGH